MTYTVVSGSNVLLRAYVGYVDLFVVSAFQQQFRRSGRIRSIVFEYVFQTVILKMFVQLLFGILHDKKMDIY